MPLCIRSMVGMIPLFAVETLEPEIVDRLPGFKRRMEWFLENRQRPDAKRGMHEVTGRYERRLLSIVDGDQLRRVLRYMLDETEFLSPLWSSRALPRYTKTSPTVLPVNGSYYTVAYEPAESTTGMFGGNSNWRGPIWFPVNFLLIESLQKFHHYFGDDFKVECPTGSGAYLTLWEVAAEISRRLTRIFLRDDTGVRPVHAAVSAVPGRSDTGEISFCSTSTFTVMTGRASAPATRQGGLD